MQLKMNVREHLYREQIIKRLTELLVNDSINVTEKTIAEIYELTSITEEIYFSDLYKTDQLCYMYKTLFAEELMTALNLNVLNFYYRLCQTDTFCIFAGIQLLDLSEIEPII